MVVINPPFIIAIIAIILIAVTKWLEWYLFKHDSFRIEGKREEAPEIRIKGEGKNVPVRGRQSGKLAAFGKKLKELLFFGKADLKRPGYGGIPAGIFVFVTMLFHVTRNMRSWQLLLYLFIMIAVVTGSELFFILRANSEFFSAEGRKGRYIKTQIAQCSLTTIIVVLLFAGWLFPGNRLTESIFPDTDLPGLKDSVDWVIEPKFEGDWPQFSEGLAAVGYQGEKGFIDKTGNTAISFQYNDARNFHEGLAAVQKDWRWGYLDQKGNVVIPFQFQEAWEFNGGLAPVKKDGKWAVIDRNGNVLFPTDYSCIYPFSEGIAQVEVRDKRHRDEIHQNLIDTSGKLLLKGDYEFTGGFHEGCIFAWNKATGKQYYLDKNEEKAVPQDFLDASGFSGGFAAVCLENGDYALIDHDGNIVKELSEEEYIDRQLCHEGLVISNNGKGDGRGYTGDPKLKYGFTDLYGKVLIPAEFSDVSFPSEGLIAIAVDGTWGFIKNPLPEAARGVDQELWAADKTQIGTVEGLPVYAGELESRAYSLREDTPPMIGIPALKQAFEELKAEKAGEKYGKDMEPDKIRYQIGDSYYKKLLLESN